MVTLPLSPAERCAALERTFASARFLPDWADVRRLRSAFAASFSAGVLGSGAPRR